MKKLIKHCLIVLACTAPAYAWAGPSILDVKHSIVDENVVAPESFETKAIELEANFYLQNFSADAATTGQPTLGTPELYQQRLSQLPTEIEMPYNDVVRKFIELYIGKRAKLVSDMLALHSYYGPIFIEELEKEGLPLELQYLPVIESAINPNAVSRAGATGLWQFMPGTAKGLGMEVNTLVDQRRDPRVSSRYAAKYLKQLYDIYGDWSLAIAAYNCGPGNVNKAIKRAGAKAGEKKDFWEIYFYLPSETRGYLPAFIAANYVMNYYGQHGIQPRVVKQPLVTDTVQVANRVNFNQISAVLNIPVEEIRMLNPQFRKDIIPGNNHPYVLTLPSAQILSYVMSEQEILDYERDTYAQRTYVEPGQKSSAEEPSVEVDPSQQSTNAEGNTDLAAVDLDKPIRITHTVAHGENLRDIAKKYNVSATDIKRWNNLRRAKVQEGDQLVIETYDRSFASTGTEVATATTKSDVPQPPRKKDTAPASVPEPAKKETAKSGSASTVPAPAKSSTSGSTGGRSSTSASASETTSQKQRRKANEGSGSGTTASTSGSSKKSSSKSSSKKSTTPAKPKTVTAKKGDSLEKIARANGCSVDELKKANGLKGDMIREGQQLKVPQKSSSKSTSKSSTSSKKSSSSSSKKSTTTKKSTKKKK